MKLLNWIEPNKLDWKQLSVNPTAIYLSKNPSNSKY